MEIRGPSRAEIILKKNKAEGLTPPAFKTYSKGIVVKVQ